MHESREPSYYEVALTSKQVAGALLVLFACLFAAFFGGLWVGRAGQAGASEQQLLHLSPASPPAVERQEPPAPRVVTPGEEGLPKIETSAASPPSEPTADTTLAEEVGAAADTGQGPGAGEAASPLGDEPVPDRTDAPVPPPPATTAPTPGPADPTGVPRWKQRLDAAREAERLEQEFASATGAPASPTKVTPAEPAPAAAPAPTKPAPAVAPAKPAFAIQVLVTRDRTRAQQLLERLRANGYPASLSSFSQNGVELVRVRVGPYREKQRADGIAAEVRAKLQLDTWVTTETP
ncbi:MAG TPA: SPOR domain-containing protein [Thermoanaerobaculia bacterium]|nr:SPOR domain-containing protein [Thermoanaerobaculia bacterium]